VIEGFNWKPQSGEKRNERGKKIMPSLFQAEEVTHWVKGGIRAKKSPQRKLHKLYK